MNPFEVWLYTKPFPSPESVRQLLHEPRERQLIGDYLVTAEDIISLRIYLSESGTEIDTMDDNYPTGTTPPITNLF